MAKRGRIPKETKEKGKKEKKHATYCQKPFTWSFITVNNHRTQDVQRRVSRYGPRKKRNIRKRENTVFFPSLYSSLIS